MFSQGASFLTFQRETAMEVLYVFSSCVVGIVCLLCFSREIKKRWEWKPNLPQGNMGWPLFGETVDFISCALTSRPEKFFNTRRLLHGKVFKSHLFGSPTIVCIDSEVSKVILQDDGKAFIPSYPRSLNELMGKSSILMLNGSIQKKLHRLIGSFLKSPELKHLLTLDFTNYVLKAMSGWNEDRTVYLQEEAKSVSFQMLMKVLLSLQAGEDMEFLREQYLQFSAGFISLPVKLPGTRLYKSLQAKSKMLKVLRTVMEGKKQSIRNGRRPQDVMEALLSSSDEEFTDDLITDNIIDLTIPGEDSVPMLITLAVKFLSDCPSALQQLREENMKMKKLKEETKETMAWSDYMSMPFTQNVITETLRLGTIITGVMRKSLHDVEIRGFLIPKNWCVFIYLRSIHLDEQLYELSYEFNPWRWQEKETTASSFVAFGGGQRLCPGQEMSRLQASIFLHHLVTNFRWKAVEDVVMNFPTVRMKGGLPIRITRIEGRGFISGCRKRQKFGNYSL